MVSCASLILLFQNLVAQPDAGPADVDLARPLNKRTDFPVAFAAERAEGIPFSPRLSFETGEEPGPETRLSLALLVCLKRLLFHANHRTASTKLPTASLGNVLARVGGVEECIEFAAPCAREHRTSCRPELATSPIDCGRQYRRPFVAHQRAAPSRILPPDCFSRQNRRISGQVFCLSSLFICRNRRNCREKGWR